MNLKTLILKAGLYFSTHSFARRCVSSVGLLTVLFCAVFFGKIYGAIGLMTIISTLALFEFYKLAEHFGGKPRIPMGLFLGAVLVPFFFYAAEREPAETANNALVFLYIAAVLFLLGWLLMWKQKIPQWAKALSTVLGVLYIPLMVSFFSLLAGLHGMNGVLLCVWVVLAAKFTDIGGLLIGCRFGKHKLAPSVSPNKTWEGVFGGIAFSMTFSAGLVWAFNYFGAWQPANPALVAGCFTPFAAALWAVPIAAVSVVSDLIESAIKRQAGDKDSGATIPGIGGALDLLDSLIFVAPVGYAIVTYAVLS